MRVLSRLRIQLLTPLQWLVNLIYYFIQKSEIRKSIPPITDELLNTSATKLAEKIRKLEVSSEELVLAYVKRIQDVNPIINAVVEDRFSNALAEAKKVDDYLKHWNNPDLDLARLKPLLGVPVTIKECIAVEGLSYTGCSLTRKNVKAERNAEAVELLKEAGAIIMLVSSTPEYSRTVETYNNIIGRTKNPYDTRYSCGGSSGGEGALVGSGASLIGIGTDIGGSIRIPSAFNCIYGHKPTPGVVPIKDTFPWIDDERFSEYQVIGPMVRYAEDLKLTFSVLAGLHTDKLHLNEQVDFQNLNLYYMEDSSQEFGLPKVDKAVKKAIKEAVQYLNENFKCKVNEKKFPEMGDTPEMMGLIFRFNNAPNAFTDSPIKYNMGTEFFKLLTGRSIFPFYTFAFGVLAKMKYFISDKDITLYLKKISEFKETFSSTLGSNGVFLYPNYPTEPFKHNGSIKGLIGGRFTVIFNLLGCPSTSVPIGLSSNGLPLSIQVVAAPYQDHLSIEVATELGKHFGGWQPPF